MQRRRRGQPAPDTAPSPAAPEPAWTHAVSTAPSNEEIVALVSQQAVSSDEASWLLQVDASALEAGTEPQQEAEAPAVEEAPPETGPPVRRPAGRLGGVFDDHREQAPRMRLTLSANQRAELAHFKRRWEANRSRYEAVAAQAGVPALLIAAIHYRESGMDFGTYLHQGDPLGRPAVNHPRSIPIFHVWEEAAIHALASKRGVADSLDLTAETTDRSAIATYAEAYNGLGYHYRDLESPYVYAGSDRYTGGRFVADGRFDPNSMDGRVGILTIYEAIEGGGADLGPVRDPWEAVAAGERLLRIGARGDAVRTLQERLGELGYDLDVDGAFGPQTHSVVRRFQADNGLDVDGVVGPATVAAFEGAARARDPGTEEVTEGTGEQEETTPEQTTPEQTTPEQTTPEAAREVDPAWAAIRDGDLLSRGARGAAVRVLQQRLVELGERIGVDGIFGPRTRAAVVAAQRRLGVQVDGVVGPETSAALDAALGR